MKKIIATFLIFAVVVSLHSISSFGSDDSLEYSIQPRGFVAFELDGETVTPFKTYQYVASTKVTEAIKNVPNWLQNELLTTFENLDLCSIKTSDKSRPAFGDINADGSKDLVVIDQKGTVQVYLDQNFTYQLCLKKDISFTIDLPEEEEEEEEEKEDLILPITPSLFDLNKDKKSDLFYGLENKIFYCENTSTKDVISFKDPELIYVIEPKEKTDSKPLDEEEPEPEPEPEEVDEALSPCVFYLGDKTCMAIGKADGTLTLLEYKEDVEEDKNFWVENPNYFVSWNEQWEENPTKEGVAVKEFATPSILYPEDGYDAFFKTMCVGASDGSFSFFVIHTKAMFPQVQTMDMFESFSTPLWVAPSFCDVNKDGRIDFVFGSEEGKIYSILNYGKDYKMAWTPLDSKSEENNLTNFFGGIGFHRAYDPVCCVGNNSELIETVAQFIIDTDEKYIDEIAYCIANFQVADIKQYFSENIQSVLIDNVEGIYKMADSVNYCSIVEKDNYTTLSYKTKKQDKESPEDYTIVDIELEKDIYYNYLVMMNRYLLVPTRWEEYYKENFYRTFLPYDETYVNKTDEENPDKPSKVTLFERVKDSETMYDAAWHIMFWLKDDIGGVWHTGDKPRGWYNIYNNLLNKDVGVWCGEWSIIFEACARSMNIPTVIIVGLGEDHQYNNFYDNGWHHVDPSAGESGNTGTWEPYIGNSLIYYEKWGKRIFSWPMEWEGNGKYDHVWRSKLPYNPPEKLTNMSFRVVDQNYRPVEGARVELWSHWPMENKYVPVPFPSAFGYSDSFGNTSIEKVGHQNFTCVVTSRIGTTNFFIPLRDAKSTKECKYEVIIPGKIPTLYNYNMAAEPNFNHDDIKPIRYKATEETEPWTKEDGIMQYMPVSVLEHAECTVTVNDSTATIKHKKHTLKVTVGESKAFLDGNEIELDDYQMAILHNQEIYIPLNLTIYLEIETRFNEMQKEYAFYIVEIRELGIKFKDPMAYQKNYHWIDGYTSILDYVDYWKPEVSTFDCLILPEIEFWNFLNGSDVHQCDWITIADNYPTSSFGSTLPKDGKYYVVFINNNFSTEVSGKVSFTVNP